MERRVSWSATVTINNHPYAISDSQTLNMDNSDTEHIDTEGSDTEDSDTEEDIDTEDVDTEDVDTEDVDSEDIVTEDISTGDISTEDVEMEDIPHEDQKTVKRAHIFGSVPELRGHLKKLVNWKPTERGNTDTESDGYDGFGRRKLCSIIEENWRCPMEAVLRDKDKGIDIHPHIPPTRAGELSEWTKRQCKKRGESIKDFLKRYNDAPKNPLDFGFLILSHLALISEYTPNMGDEMLELLNAAVQARKAKHRGKKTNDLLLEDLMKVINRLIRETRA